MKKSLTKRALSLVLCVVMLVSCWVFSAPSASAADTSATINNQSITIGTTEPTDSNAKGQYKVRIMLCEDTESGGGFIGIGKWYKRFDKSVHDYWGGIGAHKTEYIDGLVYSTSTIQSNGNAKRNISGTEMKNDLDANGNKNPNNNKNWKKYPYWCEWAQICYKNTNGTGDSGSVWFNIGDADATGRHDVVSDQGHDYGYFPSDEGVLINGFPTSFTTRMYEQSGSDPDAYYAYLQIATWNSSTKKWEWSGNNGGNGTLASSTVKSDGTNYRNGIASVHPGTDSGNGAVELKATATVGNSYYPKPASTTFTPAYSDTSTWYCPKESDDAATTRTLNYTDPVDQYGVKMVHTISVASSVTSNLVGTDGLAQSEKTTSVGFNQNIKTTTNSQQITATLKWPYKNSSGTSTSFSKTVTKNLYDAQYTVKFKDYTGKIVQNGNNADYTQTISYGDNASFPAASTYKNYYNDDNHYTFNTWDPSNTNVTSDRTCVPQYTETAHTMVNDNTIQGYVAATCTEDGVQTKKCSGCDYTTANTTIPALGHSFKLAQTKAEDGQQGYIYYECERVESCGKYCYASYDAQTGEYSKVNENNPVDYSAITSDPQTANKIPAPLFNDRVTSEKIYQRFDYSKRQASFKYMSGEEIGKQTVRFAGSVKIPEGIGYDNTQEDNQIIDFGFVYTQESFILDENDKPDPDKLVFCEDEFYDSERKTNYDNPSKAGYRVYKMSLAENNPSISNIKYWTGCTLQESGNVTGYDYITFNLVVNVNAKNWHKNYVCRPYIVYNFRGKVYTVYDAGASNGETKYFSRSIASLTNDIMKSDMLFNVDTPVYYDSQEFSLEDFMRSIFVDKGYDYDDYCSFAQRYINDKDYVETRIIDHYLETYDESDEERADTVSLFENGVGWLSSTDAYNILHDENSDIMNFFYNV